ncbi:MAG: FecR family protein [Gallionella sp.]
MTSDQEAGSHVYVVKGSVYAAQGKNPAHRVSNNEIIVSDTVITTVDNSAALLKFEDGQIVAMQSNSTFRVREYRYDARKAENSSIIFSMLKGGMRFVTGLIGQQRKQAFRLLTPNATLGIRGTEFMVAMVDNSLYSQVQSGKVSMTNAAGVTVLGAGQSAVVASSGALVSVISASAIPAGAFSDLISIPLNPSAIPALAPVPVAIAAPVPVPVPLPEPPVEVSTQAVEPPAEVSVAEPAAQRETEGRSGAALTAKASTLGLGADLNLSISDSMSARFGFNSGTYYSANSNITGYDSNVLLQTVNALADWYPYQGSFRATGGLFYNNNKATLNAIPGTNGIVIDGVPYLGVTSMQGTLTFNAIAPYLGIGWGNPVAKDKGWGLVTDIGVLFQGAPNVDLVTTCTTGCPPASAIAAEQAKLEDQVSKFKLWPVVSIGISYQW